MADFSPEEQQKLRDFQRKYDVGCREWFGPKNSMNNLVFLLVVLKKQPQTSTGVEAEEGRSICVRGLKSDDDILEFHKRIVDESYATELSPFGPTLCGRTLRTTRHDGVMWDSTIGGLVEVDGALFAISTDHVPGTNARRNTDSESSPGESTIVPEEYDQDVEPPLLLDFQPLSDPPQAVSSKEVIGAPHSPSPPFSVRDGETGFRGSDWRLIPVSSANSFPNFFTGGSLGDLQTMPDQGHYVYVKDFVQSPSRRAFIKAKGEDIDRPNFEREVLSSSVLEASERTDHLARALQEAQRQNKEFREEKGGLGEVLLEHGNDLRRILSSEPAAWEAKKPIFGELRRAYERVSNKPPPFPDALGSGQEKTGIFSGRAAGKAVASRSRLREDHISEIGATSASGALLKFSWSTLKSEARAPATVIDQTSSGFRIVRDTLIISSMIMLMGAVAGLAAALALRAGPGQGDFAGSLSNVSAAAAGLRVAAVAAGAPLFVDTCSHFYLLAYYEPRRESARSFKARAALFLGTWSMTIAWDVLGGYTFAKVARNHSVDVGSNGAAAAAGATFGAIMVLWQPLWMVLGRHLH
ncbi:hypothetical protein OQA88_8391 [Cercophora sp. LCS_1]